MKSPIGRLSLVLAVVAVAGLLLGAALLSGSVDRRIQLPANNIDEVKVVGSGFTRLEVSVVESDIRWRESSDDRIRLTLQGHVDRNPPTLHVTESGTTLLVEVRQPKGLAWRSETVLTIHAPRKKWASLALRTVSGDLILGDVDADEFVAETVSGDLTLENMETAKFMAETISGDIEIDGLRATITGVSSVSGDCTLRGIPGALNYKSTSGDLDAVWERLTGNLSLRSTSGEISLDLPDGAGFILEAESVSGEIECEFPLTILRSGRGEHQLQGTAGAGGSRVAINTISGDARIY